MVKIIKLQESMLILLLQALRKLGVGNGRFLRLVRALTGSKPQHFESLHFELSTQTQKLPKRSDFLSTAAWTGCKMAPPNQADGMDNRIKAIPETHPPIGTLEKSG